jgi:hypothetical protein
MPFLLSSMSAPEEDNYLMKVLFSYLEFLHYFRLSVSTFVEFYPFGTIRCIKENDVRSWTLFEKCTMASSSNFCRNRSTSIVSSQNVFFCSFLPMLFWIAQSHWFLWLIYFQTFTTINCLNFSNYSCTLFRGGKK